MTEQSDLNGHGSKSRAFRLGSQGLILGAFAGIVNLAMVGIALLVKLADSVSRQDFQGVEKWTLELTAGGVLLGVILFFVSIAIMAARRLRGGLGFIAIALGVLLGIQGGLIFSLFGPLGAILGAGLPGVFVLQTVATWKKELRES